MRSERDRFLKRLSRRKRRETFFHALFLTAAALGIVALVVLLTDVTRKGIGWLDWDFLTHFPSRFPDNAGIKSALFGTVWVIGLTVLFSFPIGVGTALYLEEYARSNRTTRLIQTNIANLAGVPSVVYGILGMAVFVRVLGLGSSVLAGALTMTLVILPIIVISAQEAIRSIPSSIREASYALGATRWQTVRHAVLPPALPSVLTGVILAVSRALGETAPLIMIGALTFIAFTPQSPMDPFTVLPIQIFNWTSRPQQEFSELAAAGIIVLLALLLTLNAAAVLIRNKYQKRSES